MSANLTVQDLFTLILFLMGIGVLVYLILVLNKVNKILGQARDIASANIKEIDTTIKQLPEISQNINAITKETKETLETLQPEVNSLVQNINSISCKVNDITNVIDETTHKVGDTVVVVSDSISDTAEAFQLNAKNITEYIAIIKEIFNMIKKALQKN
ncbi:hypothetical protein [Tissierella sp. Yu-01]|uniref:hypothetical protein n=1 Tax=Tissierella sp. Yu-01 TaxID=3035694 RepID=UPI00240DFD93|nr:hypothetical protein [Tissierella sp. Yu-01]WFA09436.1 hypothetical protein P3962_02350 [Tissierella sp. Yu-01]